MRFIQQTETSATGKKYIKATVERDFLKIVFSDLLNIRKGY